MVLVAVAVEPKEVGPADKVLTVAHLVTVVVAVLVLEFELVEVTELLADVASMEVTVEVADSAVCG